VADLKEFDNQKVLVDDPIYSEYDLSDVDDESFTRLTKSGSIDAYCPNCKSKSVFRILGSESYQIAEEAKKATKFGLVVVHRKCVRQDVDRPLGKCDHNFYVIFSRDGNDLVKIGQYPSKADIDFGELDDSYKELPPKLRTELGTAIGLFAHGVGIGSFVYLRRISEALVEEARLQAQSESALNAEEFARARMTEKISMLKNHLPSRLVKSAHPYGILSKGIHELSEEECKEKFMLVRQAIQLILKQKHEDKEYENIISSVHQS
jgi:hypothetical protein